MKKLEKELMAEIKMFWDSYDNWGCAMDWWFTIADCLYWRGEDVPNEWEYSPGACTGEPDPEDYNRSIVERYDSETVRSVGNLMARAARIFEARGESY